MFAYLTPKRQFFALAVFSNLVPTLFAIPSEGIGEDELKVNGIFDSILPITAPRNSFRMILHPHLGDFHRHDSIRLPVGMRYGLTDKWEATAEVETFVSHGFGDLAWGEDFGLSGVRIGTRYRGRFFPNYEWDQVSGFDFSFPAWETPEELTDGLSHFRPFMNFARRLEDRPSTLVFWGVGLDLADDTRFSGVHLKNALDDSANNFTLGGVWEHDRYAVTLECNYATTRMLGDEDRDLLTLKPGVIFKVPRGFSDDSRDDWIIGLGLRLDYGEDGLDVGVSAKLRINLNLKHH